MVAQLVASRALRDTVFLSEYSAALLPRVMLAAAALSLVAAVVVGRWMPRSGPRATAATLSVVSGGFFVVEGVLLADRPDLTAVLLYLHASVFGALVISAFSSVVNERFDPLHAKTVVAQAGTGGALGGVVGGVAGLFLAETLSVGTVLYGLGGVSVLTAVGMWHIGKSTQPDHRQAEDAQTGISAIFSDRYLRNIAITIVLLGATGVFVDYAMKAEADLRFSDSGALLSFFTLFYTGTAFLTFLVQAGFAKPLLARFGLGGTMAVLPVSVALFAAGGSAVTNLVTATLARGTQTIVSSSLFRSGYELLYTPIAPKKKRATKAVIDIACNRIGYGVGSVVIMGLVATTATLDIATKWVLVAATAVAVGCTWMIRRLHSGYVAELASSLRDGSIILQSEDVVDATTLHTLAQSAAAMNRHELLESIERLHHGHETGEDEARREVTIAQLSALLSNDTQQVLATLVDPALDPSLASHVIGHLGRDLYARPAYAALESMGSRITGQLVDTLLSPEAPVPVRRRVPRLLRKIGDGRAISGLVEGLQDDEFEVRYRCGHALGALRKALPDTPVDKDAIMRVVGREVAADEAQWTRSKAGEPVAEDLRDEIDSLLESRKDRNLQHVFTLLSLVYDRDAIVLSLRALSSNDGNLRGTALEYLHNVLPEAVREALWPRLTQELGRPRGASKATSPDELLRSMHSLMLDRDRLVK